MPVQWLQSVLAPTIEGYIVVIEGFESLKVSILTIGVF